MSKFDIVMIIFMVSLVLAGLIFSGQFIMLPMLARLGIALPAVGLIFYWIVARKE